MKKLFNLPIGYLLKSLSVIIIALVASLMSIISSDSFFKIAYADEQPKNVIMQDIINDASISGAYRIVSASDTDYCLDVNGGILLKNSVAVNCFENHDGANQKFIFNAIDFSESYIYTISTYYSQYYVLDMVNGSSENGCKLQIYENNNTNAQKFMVKEVYRLVNDEYTFVGYAILTGASNYTNVLTRNADNSVVQLDFSEDNLNLSQIWYLEKAFSGYSYDKSGYLDSNKNFGGYNTVNYNIGGNYNNGFYANTEYWSLFEDFLTISTTNGWNAQNARITQYGYAFLDSVTLDVKIDNALSKKYGIFGLQTIKVDKDSSNLVNGKYVDGEVGKGSVEVEYIDDNNNSFSIFTNDVFSKSTSDLVYDNGVSGHTFNKVGRYVVRVYYKVKADSTIYVMKELSFAIISSSSDCEVIKADTSGDQSKVISSYSLYINDNNDIDMTYNGNTDYMATEEEVVDFVSGAIYETDATKKEEKINQLKSDILKFNEYKIYFTNTAFYVNAKGNKFVNILETVYGYSEGVTTSYQGQTSSHPTDGVYDFISENLYVNGKNFYKVYVQCQPHQQVFRNVTYCYQNEEGQTINYAIDYAFLEDLKVFPYTMTTKIVYKDLSNENAAEIEYESNTIIYNTTQDILKLEFTIWDVSGNKNTLLLYLYPPMAPSVNKDALVEWSYRYNYITTGYSVMLYDNESKTYQNNLFSSEHVAIENLLTNIITNPDVCTKNADYSYDLKFNPDGSDKVLHFDSNDKLVEYIYQYAGTNITFTTISPRDYDNYVIPEKIMHYDTLYLSPDFYFSTDKYFPLFESYKIYFQYYSSNHDLIKEGVITYDSEYRYGQTMLQILANNDMENWHDGYVNFLEYNISSNSGTSYTAYIVNSNSSIQIKSKNGTTITNLIYDSSQNIVCEEFEIKDILSKDTTIIIEHNGNSNIINYFNYSQQKYTELGQYVITIINTHDFSYQITITVDGLGSSVDGVENFGTANENVTFTTTDLNFEYYINGKKQSTNNFTSYENGIYTFTFTKQNIEQNIYITKNGKSFSFIMVGDTPFNTDIYKVDEDEYYTPAMLKQYKNEIEDKFEVLENDILKINNLIDEFNVGIIKNFSPNDLQTNRYDFIIDKLNQTQNLINDSLLYVQELNELQNTFFAQNERYDNISVLEEKVKILQTLLEQEKPKLEGYTIKFFNALSININDKIYENIEFLNKQEILDLYNEYKQNLSKYKNIENNIYDLKNKVINIQYNYEKIQKEIEFTNTNYDYSVRIQKFNEILKNTENFETENYKILLQFKTEIKNYSSIYDVNPFINYYSIEQIKKSCTEVLNLINDCEFIDYNDIYLQIQQNIFSDISDYTSLYTSKIANLENIYNINLKQIEKCESEKAWWKIFTNISLNNQINELKSELKSLYASNFNLYNDLTSTISTLKRQLSEIQSSSNKISIDNYLFDILTNLQRYADEVFNKLKKV